MRLKRLRTWPAFLAIALAGASAIILSFALPHEGHKRLMGRIVHACPRGTTRVAEAEEGDRDAGAGKLHCESRFRPESFGDLSRATGAAASHETAPFTSVNPGAYEAAVRQRNAMSAGATGGSWAPYGISPEVMDNTNFDQSNGSTSEGLGTASGRISDYAYDAAHKTLYAAASNGGVWKTTNLGQSWQSVGDSLPTQVVSAVAYSPAKGGTLLVLTGDDAFGFDSLGGLGL